MEDGVKIQNTELLFSCTKSTPNYPSLIVNGTAVPNVNEPVSTLERNEKMINAKKVLES